MNGVKKLKAFCTLSRYQPQTLRNFSDKTICFSSRACERKLPPKGGEFKGLSATPGAACQMWAASDRQKHSDWKSQGRRSINGQFPAYPGGSGGDPGKGHGAYA